MFSAKIVIPQLNHGDYKRIFLMPALYQISWRAHLALDIWNNKTTGI